MEKYDFKTHVKIVKALRFNDFVGEIVLKIMFFMPLVICIIYFVPGGKELYAKIPYINFSNFRISNFKIENVLMLLGFCSIPILFSFLVSMLTIFYMSAVLEKSFGKEIVQKFMEVYTYMDIEDFEGKTFGYEKFKNILSRKEWEEKRKRKEEEEELRKYLEEKGLLELFERKEESNEKKCWEICEKLFSVFDKVKIVLSGATFALLPFAIYLISKQQDYRNIYFVFASVSAFCFIIFFGKSFIHLKINKIKKILSILYPEKIFSPDWKLEKEVDEIKKEVYKKIPVSKRSEILQLQLKKYFLEEVVQHIKK